MQELQPTITSKINQNADSLVFLRTLRNIGFHILLFSLALLVAFCVELTQNFRSNPIYVGPDGDFQSLQKALENVSEGTEIHVHPDYHISVADLIDAKFTHVTIVFKKNIKQNQKGLFYKILNFDFKIYLRWLIITLLVKIPIFGLFHQYQVYGKYASISEVYNTFYASIISAFILVLGYYGSMIVFRSTMYELNLAEIPIKIMILDWMFTVFIISLSYTITRLHAQETKGQRFSNILIVGAGNAGESLSREIIRNETAPYHVVGFVDDDPQKQGMRIHGRPVLGTCSEIKQLARNNNIDEVVIAMPSAPPKKIRSVIEQCEGINLKFTKVPDLVSIASGRFRVSQMQEVEIDDLLGRDPVQLDVDHISTFLKDKVVLVTGAGGSIGSEMCRQIGAFKPNTLILLEQAENGLFFIDRELRKEFPDIAIKAHICDIIDKKRLKTIFSHYKPEVVIHAAAHKHVPIMEIDPGEAVKNNIIGTRNIAQIAHEFQVERFVMISTDKAVNPTSIMGSSKRFAEMIIQCINQRSNTQFITVRFGNVLGSNGSVIPIFKKQIESGGPVTVTDKRMQRYFMTIPEASQLVLQAAVLGHGGEIFVLDMGEPVKIDKLAHEMITLSGLVPNEDIDIVYTGMRPGEKLFEELAMDAEDMQPTRHEKIGIWKNALPNELQLNEVIDRLLTMADQPNNHAAIVGLIKEIIPEYVGDVDCHTLHQTHIKKNNHGNGFDNYKN